MSGPSADCPPPAPEGERPPVPIWSRVLGYLCRYLLAAVFLMAAVTKLSDLPEFTTRTQLHSGLPARVAWVVAVGLPWLELTCGVCLVLGVAVREATLILCVLLVLFLIYAVLHRGDADCGCLLFPRALQQANQWPWVPIRDVLLLACGIRLVWRG